MPRVPYRFPEPEEDPIADRIRARRGERGLTPLDGTLLNAPGIADGWNSLIGTLRSKNSLPDDIRELMILRVSVLNEAAFEWIHHEHPGRAGGLSTAQLAAIADKSTTSSPALNPLQQAALAFTDASTLHIKVPDGVFSALRRELQANLEATQNSANVTVERQLVEATATVGGYNLVSRFLVALDVDDRASSSIPAPMSGSTLFQDYPVYISPDVTLHSRVHWHPTNSRAPSLLFVNSLLTNTSMWSRVLEQFTTAGYTIITFDQRGHGKSSCPPTPSKIPILAKDIARILDYLQIKKVHGIIGVSQGGATALSFALQFPQRVHRLVVCDTQAASPAANKAAWDDRISVARNDGMEKLAEATAPRWFPAPNSTFGPPKGSQLGGKDWEFLKDMITGTTVDAFAKSAAALQSYDLRADGLINSLKGATSSAEDPMRVLLLAGALDGALPAGLKALRDEIGGTNVEFVEIEGSRHLPMLDGPERFVDAVEPFLRS